MTVFVCIGRRSSCWKSWRVLPMRSPYRPRRVEFADRLVEVSVHVFLVDLPDIRLVVMLRKFIGVLGES